jgi:Circularly permutated YpsA SLOG family
MDYKVIYSPNAISDLAEIVRFVLIEHANKLGKPVLHIYDTRKERMLNQDSLRLEIQALTNFQRSKKIEILNLPSPRESKEPGVYERTVTMLRLFLNRMVIRTRNS